MKPDPASSPCPVWTGNGNVVSCCRSSSGRPLSADCGGRIAPGASSSDVSSLLHPHHILLSSNFALSLHSFSEIRRSSEICRTVWFHSILYECMNLTSCVRASMVFWSSLANLRLWITSSYFPTASYSITTHQSLKQAPFPKMQHIKWRVITSWSSLSLSPFFSLSL